MTIPDADRSSPRRRTATRPAFALAVGLVAAALAAPAGAAPDEAAAGQAARLTGRWQLDKERSDDARSKMREARGGERPRGYGRGGGPGGGMGGMGGGGHRGGGHGGGMGGGQPGEGPDGGGNGHAPAFRDFVEPPQTLEISQDEQEVTIDGGDGRVLRLHPGGRKSKSEGGDAEVKARWNRGELVAESKLRNGAKLTNVYALAAEGRELHVTSRLDGRFGEPVTVRRVYEAASSASSAP